MGDDGLDATGRNRVVAARVLEMPVRIEQNANGCRTEPLSEQPEKISGAFGRAAIDQQQALGLGENHDVAAGAGHHAQAIP